MEMESHNTNIFGKAYSNQKIEAEVKCYSSQDFIFSVFRVAVAIYVSYIYNLVFPIILLAIVGISRLFGIIYVIKSSRIVNQGNRDLDNHSPYIIKLNKFKIIDNFLTVLLPYFSQILVALYIVGLLFICAYDSNHKVLTFILVGLMAIIICYFLFRLIEIVAKDWWKRIEITPDTIFIRKNLIEDDSFIVVFWSILYFICALFFGYHAICNPESVADIIGCLVFTASMVQTLKMIDFYNICRNEMGYARKDAISFFYFINQRRERYIKEHKRDIAILSIISTILVTGTSYMIYLFHVNYSTDILAMLISLVLSSLVLLIYVIKQLFEKHLCEADFDDEDDSDEEDEYFQVSHVKY